MKFKSPRDILLFALSKEESSVLFYQKLAARVTRPETSGILEELAGREEEHVEAMKLELMKLGYTVSDDDLTLDESEISLEMDDQIEGINFIDALRLGIQKERASFKLYARLLAMTTEPEAQEMFTELAEEEIRHVLTLEHEIEFLTHHTKE